MRFLILGNTRLLTEDGQPAPLPLGAAKQRGLLTLLLYHARQPVPVPLIVDRLWNSGEWERYRSHLYALASRIRALLRDAGGQAELRTLHRPDGYQLDIDPARIDFHVLRQRAEKARRSARDGRHDEVVRQLTEAIELRYGEPLADVQGDGADYDRNLIAQLLLGAHKTLFDSELAVGDPESVITRLGPLLADNALDDTLARQWITALDGAGRISDATAFFFDFGRRWRDEFGTEPPRSVHDAYFEALERRTVDHDTPPRQLPRDVPDFVGREDLLAAMDKLAQQPGQVIVCYGMPGIGKTALIRRWAHRRASQFRDGHIYLDASGYGPVPPATSDDILAHCLRALGVPAHRIPADGDRRRDRLGQLLADRHPLIIVDDVHDALQVRPLLWATGDSIVLISSRTRLDDLAIREAVPGIAVPRLTPAESATLISTLIGPTRAHAEPAAVDHLTSRSDGLPLAARIIGKHVATRDTARIADLVDQLPDHLLTHDETLRSVFAFSYCSLPPDEARLFRLLGLHPGQTIGADSAAALLGTAPSHATKLLESLSQSSLLEYAGADRFRLHALLRLYAAECAHLEETPEQRTAAIGRLLDWNLLSATAAAAIVSPGRAPVPDLPQPGPTPPRHFGHANDAVQWCEWERSNLIESARLAAENAFHTRSWQLAGATFNIYRRFGRQDDVLAVQEIALPAARISGHTEGIIGTLNNLALAFIEHSDYDQAIVHLESGLHLAKTEGHREGQAVCLHNLGRLRMERGDIHTAIQLYQQAAQRYHELGKPSGEAFSLHRLGDAYRHQRQYDKALRYYRRALQLRQDIGDVQDQISTHAAIGALHVDLGDDRTALVHCQRALVLYAEAKDQAAAASALITAAQVHLRRNRPAIAHREASLAAALCDEVGARILHAKALEILLTFPAGPDATNTSVADVAADLTEEINSQKAV